MIVYKYTNLINGKVYIGITTRSLEIRHNEHIKGIGDGTYFHNALGKYGEDNFIYEIIDTAETFEELKQKEKYWIKKYNSYSYKKNSNGYNCTYGGDGVQLFGELNPQYGVSPQERMDDETFKKWLTNLKLSAKKGIENKFYGKHPIEIFGEDGWSKTIEKARKRWSGEENPQKLNARSGENHPHYGKIFSQKVRISMSNGKKNKKLTHENVIKIRELYSTCNYTQKEIADLFNVSRGTVYDVVHNKIYTYLPNDIDDNVKIKHLENRTKKNSKKVAKIENGNITECYSSIVEAAKRNSMSVAGVKKHLYNKVKEPRFIYI